MKDNYSTYKKKQKLLFAIIMILAIMIGSIYIYSIWNKHTLRVEKNAINLASSIASFIDPEVIMGLSVNSFDTQSSYYQSLKSVLLNFRNNRPDIHVAYLLALKNDTLYSIVSSKSSTDFSNSIQEYYDAPEEYALPFSNGKALLTKPFTDHWGTWVSALAPIKNPENGKVIAVLVIDYPYQYWKAEMNRPITHVVIVVIVVLLLLTLFYRSLLSNFRLQELSVELRKREELFAAVFEQAPIGIALKNSLGTLIERNKAFEDILGRSGHELISLNWMDITDPDDRKDELAQFQQLELGEISEYFLEKRFLKPDGSSVWVNYIISELMISANFSVDKYYLCMLQDIHERKITEEAMKESERSKRVLLENLPGMAYRCKYDKEWTMEFVSDGCHALTGYNANSLIYNKDLSFNDLIVASYRDLIWDEWSRVLDSRKLFRYEYEIVTASGDHKWVLETGQGVFSNNGKIDALEGIIIDITEAKKRQYQLEYFHDHDFMTGLYNRRYYEKEKTRIDQSGVVPLSILIVDINGLKMINDTYGHTEGDHIINATASILQSHCREGDLLARTAGDDFKIILPNTDSEKAYEILQNIKVAFKNLNHKILEKEKHFNITIGLGTKINKDDSLDETEKEAEDHLRTRKLFAQNSHYNSLLNSIMTTLYARSHETEEHSKRIYTISKMIAQKIGLSLNDLNDLHLFSMLHDIGKVGIDDRILNKPGKLTQEEWDIMKTHSEIGNHIVISVPEFASVADCILTHHERWDGNGYPLGLSGENIPLLSRILAVADAYDAMTENRVYRPALSKGEALEEIRNNVGTQFDPRISSAFLELMLSESI